ncbi:MAG: hypothetical protein ACJ739_09780 [Acidimicrobiales bacterium]
MITTAAKWFFGLGLVSFVLAVVYGYSTGGTRLGPFTAGYYGGVGDHLGYTLLLSTTIGAVLLGITAVVTRDADPRALAELAGTEVAPAAVAPTYPSLWPLVGAFAVALVVLGLVISNVMFVVGAFLLLGTLVEWMVLAWSDHATGDPETNHLLRRRIMAPFEVPLAGFLIAAGAVIAFSRILLTSSEMGAVGVAIGIGVVVLAVGTLVALRPNLSHDAVVGVLCLLALGVVIAGVASASRGERFIEQHGEEHAQDQGDSGDLSPLTPEGTKSVTTTTAAAQGGG